MTAPRLARAGAALTVLRELRAELAPLFRALAAAFRALITALQHFTVAMHPALAQYLPSTSPRTQRRRQAAQRTPAERRAFRLEHRAQRRWLRHTGRRTR